jgi:hypothetical protein
MLPVNDEFQARHTCYRLGIANAHFQNHNPLNWSQHTVPAQSSQFHIQLDGVKLTGAQAEALAADLDKLVSSHLAKLDFKGDVVVTRPIALNPEWLGIWIRDHNLSNFVNVPSVKDVGNVLPSLKQQISRSERP